MSDSLKVNTDSSNNTYTNKKQGKNIAGGALALIAHRAVRALKAPVDTFVSSKRISALDGISSSDVNLLNNCADKILKSTGLDKKGVQITDVNSLKIINPDNYDLSNVKSSIEAIKNGFGMSYEDSINALNRSAFEECGIKKGKQLLVNRKKMTPEIFVQLGHAFNINNNSILKFMRKATIPGIAIASFFALLPAFTKQTEPEENKELSKFQKVKNFIRKNSPIIALGAMLPMFVDRLAATIKADKWIKEYTSGDLLRRAKSNNLLGLAIFAISTAAFPLMALATKVVKDSSDENRRIEFKGQMSEKNKLKAHQG